MIYSPPLLKKKFVLFYCPCSYQHIRLCGRGKQNIEINVLHRCGVCFEEYGGDVADYNVDARMKVTVQDGLVYVEVPLFYLRYGELS